MQNPPPDQQGYSNQYGTPPTNAPLSTPPGGGGPNDKSAIGMDANLTAALGYPVGPIAIIEIIIEKQNRFARFHAFQSLLLHIVCWAVLFVIWIFLFILTLISSYLAILMLLLIPILLAYIGALFFCAYKAYQGQMFKLPVIGDMAEKFASK